jgi:hypothetical protein
MEDVDDGITVRKDLEYSQTQKYWFIFQTYLTKYEHAISTNKLENGDVDGDYFTCPLMEFLINDEQLLKDHDNAMKIRSSKALLGTRNITFSRTGKAHIKTVSLKLLGPEDQRSRVPSSLYGNHIFDDYRVLQQQHQNQENKLVQPIEIMQQQVTNIVSTSLDISTVVCNGKQGVNDYLLFTSGKCDIIISSS